MLTELGGSQVEVQVFTELGRSQVEVQRCSLSSEGPRLVEVQQCPLRAEVGEELGEELARRK